MLKTRNFIEKLDLDPKEKKAFGLHTLFSIIEGVLFGFFVLNEYIFITSLNGTDFQLAFLIQFSMMVFSISIFLNELFKRVTDKRKLLRKIGIATRLPLLLLIFFPASNIDFINSNTYHYIFLTVFLIYYLATPIIFPQINLLLKFNYNHQNFGRLFGYSTQIKRIVVLIVTFGYGLLLDYDNYAFTYIIPLSGILGIISMFLLTKIAFEDNSPIQTGSLLDSMKNAYQRMINILKSNKPFRDFQIGFMLYGFAFMITVVVITLFYKDELDLKYFSVAFYKNSFNIVAILTLPICGILLGKINPRPFSAVSYLMLLLCLLFIALTEFYRTHYTITLFNSELLLYTNLIIASIFLGLFTSSVAVLWAIGSAYFCKPEEAADYQSIHLTLVGVRALFGPLLGVYIYHCFGFLTTFIIAMISLFVAIVFLTYSKITTP